MAKSPTSQTATPLERLKEIDEERKSLAQEVKETLLKTAEEAVSTLNSLGFPYRLLAGTSEGVAPRAHTKTRDCPVCKFPTHPPHDGRAHKQQDFKAPFTSEELRDKGLTRV